MYVFGCDPQAFQDFQVFGTRNVYLLLGFIRSEKFVEVSSQVKIIFRNHTEDCYVYWFNVL